jgi:hypothetical protein
MKTFRCNVYNTYSILINYKLLIDTESQYLIKGTLLIQDLTDTECIMKSHVCVYRQTEAVRGDAAR